MVADQINSMSGCGVNMSESTTAVVSLYQRQSLETTAIYIKKLNWMA